MNDGKRKIYYLYCDDMHYYVTLVNYCLKDGIHLGRPIKNKKMEVCDYLEYGCDKIFYKLNMPFSILFTNVI